MFDLVTRVQILRSFHKTGEHKTLKYFIETDPHLDVPIHLFLLCFLFLVNISLSLVYILLKQSFDVNKLVGPII